MKKVLNITMIQRILKPSLLVLIIAGSRFLPNASAMRWTVDFEKKQSGSYIKASDLDIYIEMLNFAGDSFQEVDKDIFVWVVAHDGIVGKIEEMRTAKTTGVIQRDEENNKSEITIVLKNGILEASEARKLLSGVRGAFDIEFINCSGTLDLNEDLKKHANSIRFQDCKFETASDCFKGAKVLQFFGTTLTPKNGCLGIDKTTTVNIGKNNKVSPYNMSLENVLALEQSGKLIVKQNPNKDLGRISSNVIESEKNFETKIAPRMEDVEKQLLLLQTRYNSLKGELEEIRRNKDSTQYKLKVAELEKKIEGKDSTISGLRAKVQELEKNEASIRKELVETIRNRNKEQEILSSSYEKTRTQLEDTERNNKMNEKVMEDMKKRNAQLKRQNEDLHRSQKYTKKRVEDLRVLNLKLEEANKNLEAENNALKEKIQKSSETVQTAKETLKEFKDLQEQNERLLEASYNKSGKIESLTKNIEEKDRRIRELESLLRIAGGFVNNVHPLLRDLKKNDEYIRNTLFNAGYNEEVKKFNQSLGKLYEAGKERKKQHKKCNWIDFDFEEPFSVLDDDDNDETYWENKTIYRGRGSFYGRGYRGRGKYFRGNCRGRGNGQMRINNPRGGKRGGEQRDSFDSDNH